MLKRVAHELMMAGTRTGTEVTEEKVTGLLQKCIRAVSDSEADLLLTLASQAVASDKRPDVTEVRPEMLECDVVRFQNNKEKWVAFVGLLDGYPYEIFTGLQDDDEGIVLPKTVTSGKYKTTVEGLSEKFNPEYWNYAKLISGVLRYRMPLEHVVKLVGSLSLKDESINTWKVGVERALKKYLNDGSEEVKNEE